MNIKLKAAVITAGIFASAVVVVSVLDAVFKNLTAEQVANIFSWGCMALLAFCFYKLVLINLEHKESLKKIREAD